MDRRLVQLMAAHGGALGAAQAFAAGASCEDIESWCRSGGLTRVRRGAYVDTSRYACAHPDEQYRLRVMAVLLSRGGLDPAGHHAALALHRLPLWLVDLDRIDVMARVSKQSGRAGVVVHPSRDAPSDDVEAVRAVTVACALVQTAASSGVEAGVVAADAALARRLCSPDDLAAQLAATPVVRAHRRARQMTELVDPRSESVGETRTRLLLVSAGMPVRSQVKVVDRGAVLARVDLLVGERVVVEFDGAVKYADDRTGRVLFDEKRREDRLRELGFEVVRVTWADLAYPERLLQRVRVALVRVGCRVG
ncbi:type IV toxin-antitoxin system AbiEi family antitoxin domain-containing protein [Lapillicoccus sp.]|uniref:type IV toxin-antitoxin system AbiEi family antitoxin domain-containing protein n=1 Tax=Lapillicoccus sp. TaxID=1909287 RepID=UPI003263C11C